MPLAFRTLARGLILAGLTIAPMPAHVQELPTREALWSEWSLEPLVLVPLALTSWLYFRGVRRLWAKAGRGHGISFARVLSFAAGQATLVVALVSPLDSLGGVLLSAHMAQHGLLAGIAPPLLLLGRPVVVFAWGLTPLWTSPALAHFWRQARRLERALSTPARATLLHGVTMWLWHAPALFGAAVAYEWIHAVQHIFFFVPALLFWTALLDVHSVRSAAGAMAAAFITFMHTGLLGGLITMAPEPLYTIYLPRTEACGISPLADQQLAGLLMWVPLGVPYLAAGLAPGYRLLSGHFDEKGYRAPGVQAAASMTGETAR